MAVSTVPEQTIPTVFSEVYGGQAGGITAPQLADGSILVESRLDSLGFDPFSLVTDASCPSTVQEFVDFYAVHQPQ